MKSIEGKTRLIILTYFKDVNISYYNHSFFKKLIHSNLLEVTVYSFIEFAHKHNIRVDDKCYGHGGGMILRVDFIYSLIKSININLEQWTIIHPSPSGTTLNLNTIKCFSKVNNFIIICSRYEGIDKRIKTIFKVNEISIGDYILWDGDTASFVITNSILRHKHIKEKANLYESFYTDGLLDYDKYTRPSNFHNNEAPKVLLSGNRKTIDEMNYKNMIDNTKKDRPELYEEYIKNINKENE